MTKLKALLDTLDRISQEEREIMISKNHDYSGENDCLANIKACETLGICKTEKGLLTRMLDKFQRIINLENSEAAVKDESVFTTINDLRNYLGFYYHIKLEKNGQPKPEARPADKPAT